MQKEYFVKLMKEHEDLSIDQMKSIIERSINKSGNNGDTNIVIAIEELSELQKELCKYLRRKCDKICVLEEFADTILALFYITKIIGISEDEIRNAVYAKFENLSNLL